MLQSGSALNPAWGPISRDHALQYAKLLSKNLNCNEDETNLLICLQDKDVSEIIQLTNLPGLAFGTLVWIAVPDQDLTPEPFLPGEAEELMATGNFNQDVEVIIGTNSDEGLLNIINVLVDPTQWDEYRDNFDTETIPIMFNIPNQSDITEDDIEKAHELVEFYVGSMVNINEDHKQGIFDLGTDSWFLYGTYKTIKYLLQYGVTVYQYVFHS